MSATNVPTLPPLRCSRCGGACPAGAVRHRGCEACRSAGRPAAWSWRPDAAEVAAALRAPEPLPGLWRHRRALPTQEPVTLGEGRTPLVALPRVGAAWDVPALLVKNEAANPTWSHKDRLAAVTVAMAVQSGAPVVAAASTGNHGAAVAAYAAAAGLPCVIATVDSVPPVMKGLMASYGALVVATATPEGRYELLRRGVEDLGWYPASNLEVPAVGSDPYGIAGYATIAWELWEELGDVPEWVVLPVAYGDCLAGLAAGFELLVGAGLAERTPRLVAAEVFGAYGDGLAGRALGPVPMRPTAAFSIAGAYGTHQGLAALQATDGLAVTVEEDALLAARADLGARGGLHVEAASAAAFAAARLLAAAGRIRREDRVVCLLTSAGLKDGAGLAATGPVPVVPSDLRAARDALRAAGTAEGLLARAFGAVPAGVR